MPGPSRDGGAGSEFPEPGPGSGTPSAEPEPSAVESSADMGAMRARTWTIAVRSRDPADYGIPPVPEWAVFRMQNGGLALSVLDEEEAYIAADDPVAVRR